MFYYFIIYRLDLLHRTRFYLSSLLSTSYYHHLQSWNFLSLLLVLKVRYTFWSLYKATGSITKIINPGIFIPSLTIKSSCGEQYMQYNTMPSIDNPTTEADVVFNNITTKIIGKMKISNSLPCFNLILSALKRCYSFSFPK